MPLAASDVQRVGSMRLRFSDGETGTLEYSVDGVTVTKSIIREVFAGSLATCHS